MIQALMMLAWQRLIILLGGVTRVSQVDSRETNVNVKDNEYYTKIHEELSKKYGVEKLTIAQMGGLECGKCHY